MASLKHLVRDSLAWGLERTGLTGAKKRALTIATFHRVLPAELRATYPFPGLAVTPEELDFFLTFFRARYTCGTLAESWDRFRRGDRPERPLLALTFDDGQQDNVDHALPVLRRHGLKASFYLPTDLIEERTLIWHDRVGFALRAMGESPDAIAERTEALKPLDPEHREAEVDALERIAGATPPEWARLMTWEGAEQLLTEGHEIGSHSLRHPLLPTCSDTRLRAELVESKAAIEKRLGIRVQTFCYPNGDADERVAAATAAAGYECAVTTTWGTNHPSAPPFLLRRCDMHPFHTRDRHGILSSAQLQFRLSRQL
ncbi:MAG: polysaccharide deacetylase family protein [Deltaproteobacteria bacterium]|nr:polysaccharide deacetylase family protein [Deltaproteobacteria bacterium]